MNEASERTQFDYLLNAMEHAGNEAYPAKAGYAGKRKALFAYVRDLEARAAVPAVQPQHIECAEACEKAADELMTFQLALHGGEHDKHRLAICLGIEALKLLAQSYAGVAAPQAEARQEQPKQPDSSYSAQPKGEEATARDAGAMWDRFIAHLNECDSIEHVNLLGGVAKYRQAFIDAALSSTPAQGEGGTGGGPASDGGQKNG